ncbi:MAG: hypothetical protein WBN28_13300 [Lutimonas sp.]
MKNKLFLLSVFLLISVFSIQAQEKTEKELKKEKKAEKKAAKKEKKSQPPAKGDIYFSPVPVIGVNPAMGFIYGVGASTSAFLGDPATTNISNALVGFAMTTKSQKVLTFKSAIYTEGNDYFFIGDWRFLQSSQPTWGLGTGPQSAKLVNSGFEFDDGDISNGIDEAQMLKFNFLRLYETGFKKIAESVYLGLGIHYDRFWDVEDQLLDLDADIPVITSYYAYNQKYGFDNEESTLVGVSLNGIYDTRDNQNNPYKGRYAMASFKINPDWLGSDQGSSTLWLEYRDYFNFTPDHKNILGFWTWGNFTTSGNLPYMNLPAIGWDLFAKSGRPYAQGRFRGEHMIYSEVEYRKHLWATEKNPNFLGAVAYLNMTTASAEENDINLFKYLNPGYGVGVRINLNQKARTNVGIDYGWGSYGTRGLYIRLNETF